MRPAPTSTAFHVAAALLACAFALAVWHESLGSFFAQDDFIFLESAERAAASHAPLGRAFTTVSPVDNAYRPLSTTLFYDGMVRLFGHDPRWYLRANLALHTLAGLLVYALALALTRDAPLALWAALFFLGRSIAFEPLRWSSGAQELLAGVFSLAFVLAVVRGSWLAVPALALAYWSKEVGALMPICALPVLLALDADRRPHRSWTDRLYLGLAITLGLLLFLRSCATSGHPTIHELSVGLFSLERLGRFLYWTADGNVEAQPAVLVVVVLALAALLAVPPNAAPADEDSPKPRASLWLLLAAAIAATPMVLLRSRVAQYYAYIPAAFVTLALAHAFAAMQVMDPAHRSLRRAMLLLVLAVSTVWEYDASAAKREPHFIEVKGHYTANPAYRWSGGFLYTRLQRASARMCADLARIYPAGLPAGTSLILVGWPELFISSTLASEQLAETPVTASMIRVFVGPLNATVRFVDPTADPGNPVYHVTSRGLEAITRPGAPPHDFVFVNPFTGAAVAHPELSAAPPAEVLARIREHIQSHANAR